MASTAISPSVSGSTTCQRRPRHTMASGWPVLSSTAMKGGPCRRHQSPSSAISRKPKPLERGIGLQPLEQRRVHPVVQRRPELEAFGIGQHAEHAGQWILARTSDQDGRRRAEQDDVAQALQRMRGPHLVDLTRLAPALAPVGVAPGQGGGDAPRDRRRGAPASRARTAGSSVAVSIATTSLSPAISARIWLASTRRVVGEGCPAPPPRDTAGSASRASSHRFCPRGHAGAGGEGAAVARRQWLGLGIAMGHSRRRRAAPYHASRAGRRGSHCPISGCGEGAPCSCSRKRTPGAARQRRPRPRARLATNWCGPGLPAPSRTTPRAARARASRGRAEDRRGPTDPPARPSRPGAFMPAPRPRSDAHRHRPPPSACRGCRARRCGRVPGR